MALYIEGNQVGIQTTGTRAQVPNNPYALLMYYLNCAESLISGLDFGYLTNYQKYAQLDQDDKKMLLLFVLLLDPETLIEHNIFIPVSDGSLGNTSNEFLKLTDESIRYLNIENTIEIGEHHCTVLKVMLMTKKWLKENYYDPLQTIKLLMSRPAVTYQTQRTSQPDRTDYTPTYHSSKCSATDIFCCDCSCCDWYCCDCDCCDSFGCGCCCLFLISAGLPILGLLFLIIGCCTSNSVMRCSSAYGIIIGTIIYILIFTLG